MVEPFHFPIRMDTFHVVLDLGGTFVFALRLAICRGFALAGLLTFYCYRFINRLSGSVLIFDAVGLALFAVTGATKALTYHLGPASAALLGMPRSACLRLKGHAASRATAWFVRLERHVYAYRAWGTHFSGRTHFHGA